MKVGILTFHFGRNYGALLQAYGLRKAIDSLGNETRVVHYVPQHFSGYMSSAETNLLRLGWRTYGPRLAIERRLRTFKFNHFKRKELRLSPRCRNKEELIQQVAEFDALVVGSDQVWNLNYVDSNDLCYFLDFPIPEKVRCLSYAACCGRKDQPPTYLSTVSSLLTKFHSVSVRNDVTADFVKSLANRVSTVVADPTLLDSYVDLEDGYISKSRYLLMYVLEKKSFANYEKIIGNLKKRLGMPVLAIADGNQFWHDEPIPGADRTLFGVSVGRFLSLIKQSECVVTDSFHGTIFSIKYQKPFVTLNDGGWRNMRMNDLANRYGIGQRMKSIYTGIDPTLLKWSNDLKVIKKLFSTHKETSYEFLRQSLG